MYIETYNHKKYDFIISYNKKDGTYEARCGTMYTYDEDLDGVKRKIEIKVYQNDNFRLSVDDYKGLGD